jgi:hypothetical protein
MFASSLTITNNKMTHHPQMPFKEQCILFGKLLIIWIIAALVQAL